MLLISLDEEKKKGLESGRGKKNDWAHLHNTSTNFRKKMWELEHDHTCTSNLQLKKEREKTDARRIECLEILMMPGRVLDALML